jgi:hypothetical protein
MDLAVRSPDIYSTLYIPFLQKFHSRILEWNGIILEVWLGAVTDLRRQFGGSGRLALLAVRRILACPVRVEPFAVHESNLA